MAPMPMQPMAALAPALMSMKGSPMGAVTSMPPTAAIPSIAPPIPTMATTSHPMQMPMKASNGQMISGLGMLLASTLPDSRPHRPHHDLPESGPPTSETRFSDITRATTSSSSLGVMPAERGACPSFLMSSQHAMQAESRHREAVDMHQGLR